MNRSFASLRTRRSARLALAAAVAAVAALTLALAAGADRHDAVPPPPANPTSADQIQNIDQVKTAIKAYYGDTLDTRLNPIDGTQLHTFSPTGAYANEMAGVVDRAEKYLRNPGDNGHHKSGKKKSVLFDVDDTTLNTYSYEIYTSFVYNPTTNNAFADAAVFPAVPHMVDLENYAESKGYTVFFLTGRGIARHDGTFANLTNEGYDVVDANLYLKDTAAPWLVPCGGAACTTTQYKSLTREHIESLGYDIVANFGDQFSDLNGGFADKTFKLPNPMYYLP
ncbi:MAG TPA: HAD family acid phosphatase [Gaiellaceae bacterium]